MVVAVTLASCLVAAAPAVAQPTHPSNGPLTYEELSPLHRFSITPVMEGARLAAGGSLEVDVWLGFASLFEQDSSATHIVFIDQERLVTALGARWGVTDRVEVGARALLETTGAGKLDDLIISWHDLWGFGQANRDRFPTGVYDERLTDGGSTTYLAVPRRRFAFEDARLHAKVLLHDDPARLTMLSLKAELRIPGDTNPAADELADVGLSAIGRFPMWGFWGHAMAGISTTRASAELDPIIGGPMKHAAFAVERSFGGWSAVAQYQVQSALLTGFDHKELDSPGRNLVLGVSGRFGSDWRWDASFQEDLPADTPSVDFTIGVRLTRVF